MSGKRAIRLQSVGDVRKLLCRVINGLLRDEIPPEKASKVGYLCNVIIRAFEQNDLQTRLEDLEAKLIEETSDIGWST